MQHTDVGPVTLRACSCAWSRRMHGPASGRRPFETPRQEARAPPATIASHCAGVTGEASAVSARCRGSGSKSIVAVAAEQAELRGIARRLGEAEMAEGVRGE